MRYQRALTSTVLFSLLLLTENAIAQTKPLASPLVDDPALKIECKKLSDPRFGRDEYGRIEFNFWTIRSVNKNKVLLDFGNMLRFACENYRENIYAFSENGEIVPLTFEKVIRPQMMFRDWKSSKKESTTCLCTAKKEEHLYGFCNTLRGTETYGLDLEKTKCRYIGEYTFDPKFKLKAKTLAINIPDIKSAKYEHFKMTPLKANTPEGAVFMQKKFFYPPTHYDQGVYETYYPNKENCINIQDCDVFAVTISENKHVGESDPKATYNFYKFDDCYFLGGGGFHVMIK